MGHVPLGHDGLPGGRGDDAEDLDNRSSREDRQPARVARAHDLPDLFRCDPRRRPPLSVLRSRPSLPAGVPVVLLSPAVDVAPPRLRRPRRLRPPPRGWDPRNLVPLAGLARRPSARL